MNYIQPYIGYIKKEDAKDFLKRQTIMGKILAVALTIVFGLMEYMIAPRLLSLYTDLSYQLPGYADSRIRYIVYAAAIFLLFSLRSESDQAIEDKLRRYKAGEMILVSKLTDYRYLYLAFAVLLVSMGYIIVSLILPIYNLTSIM
jgi:hypothetical protein